MIVYQKNYYPKKIMERLATSNFSILIVEDNLPFAIELDMLVREIGYTVKGRVDNSAEALEIMLTDPPDLVLMDIQIKGRLNGVELAEKMQSTNIPFLFISSLQTEEIYQRAKSTNFVGYLAKPINKFSIRTAVELAVKNIGEYNNIISEKVTAYSNEKYLFFKKRNIYHKIAIDDILYFQADDDQSITHTSNQKYYSFITLKALQELLADHSFMPVHRSYVVNLQQVTSVDVENQWLVLKNGEEIPYSRRRKEVLLRALQFRR